MLLRPHLDFGTTTDKDEKKDQKHGLRMSFHVE